MLIPLVEKKFGPFFYTLAALILLFITTIVRVQLQHYFNTDLFSNQLITRPVLFKTYSYIFFSHLLIFFSSIGFKLALSYFNIRIQQAQLLQKNALTELNLLKAQVQPHFLFNTLNNMYFVAENESPATAQLIEKLASIMRYFVDEAPKDKILLETELQFIRNLIDLEQVRMQNPLDVSYHIQVAGHLSLPPMLLIPLIENVFKHGVNHLSKHNWLTISIRQEISTLEISVCNSLNSSKQPTNVGIGLANLKHRLNLLFEQSHELNINKEEKQFSVDMRIPI